MSGTDARNDPSVIDMLAEKQPDAFEALAAACGMSKEEFARKWNQGARLADDDRRPKWEKDLATGARDDYFTGVNK